MQARTTTEVLESLPARAIPRHITRLPAPQYTAPSDVDDRPLDMLSVDRLQRHTTDEGWQLQLGLDEAGYQLHRHTNVAEIVAHEKPSVVVAQDCVEFLRPNGPLFTAYGSLAERSDIFRIAVVKDAHLAPHVQAEFASDIGAHAWVIYYHPAIVARLAHYIRPEHLIRTHHSIDADAVPRGGEFVPGERRRAAVLSGAMNAYVYPLRRKLRRFFGIEPPAGEAAGVGFAAARPEYAYLKHPGYADAGSYSAEYLRQLSQFRVAICTTSIFGYAVRKIIEATAAGCVVVTDLPADDVLPEIEGNLIRVHPATPLDEIMLTVRRAAEEWQEGWQREMSERAVARYGWREVGKRLANDIEGMRVRWSA